MTPRIAAVLVVLVVLAASLAAQADESAESPERGLVLADADRAAPGYTLIAPFSVETTYLLDLQGRVVHTWQSGYPPGLSPYLLPNGNLLRGVQVEDLPVRFEAGGITGGLQEWTWDGELVWEYLLASDRAHLHHDVEPLPNGNLLAIVWEAKTREEALAAGRRESHAGEDGMWPGAIYEIEPLPPHGARVVWEWRVWDHLVQDTDPELPGYGDPADHPRRVDINAEVPREGDDAPPEEEMSEEERRMLVALGYIDDASEDDDGDAAEDDDDADRADWLHLNGIDYNAELDQIVVSSRQMNEIWIIDHGITTEEAAGPAGDLLYRWGNPQTYRRGTEDDRQLFRQHDPQWIPAGFPGAGNITIFNNGVDRPDEEYSSIVEITPPLRADGTYQPVAKVIPHPAALVRPSSSLPDLDESTDSTAVRRLDPNRTSTTVHESTSATDCYALDDGAAFGPDEPTWEWTPPEDDRLYSSFISGTHRLANGNTLVCGGPQGRVLEVTRDGEPVWDYLNPYGELGPDGEKNVFTYGMFRATRIPPDHPGLAGRDLAPLDPAPLTAAEELAQRPPRGERPSEWRPLFDDDELRLSRWIDVNVAPDTFRLGPNPDDEDETLLIVSGEPVGFARTRDMYENFVLDLEWRHMEDGGNAGLFVWSDPLPALGGPYARGIEVQICNLGEGSWFTSHGDIFPIWGAVMTPDPRFRVSGSRSMPNEDSLHQNPTGEWNHYRVTAVDGTITLEVNGHLVTAGTDCSPSKGYLCLESEGGEVHVRDMKIWELPSGSHAAGPERTAREATGHRPLYVGELDGWDVVSGEWSADDWRLVGTGTGGVSTELPEGWTHVVLDVRGGGATPVRLGQIGGDLGAPADAETWRRVEIVRDGESATVSCGGASFEAPVADELVLANGADEVAFANVLVSTGD